MLDDAAVRDLARRLTDVPGVVGVLLGGSRARGEHHEGSDVDLGLYYRRPLDVAALRELAGAVTGAAAPGAAPEVTEPGAWGPWVDGGAWLTVEATAVDWIYRDLDRVRRSLDDAREGRLELHAQVGHPFGVLGVAYAGEVALGVVLSDPTGELTALQAAAVPYPPALRTAVVDRLWEAGFSLDGARKAAPRGDTAYVAGCLFRTVLLCAHALHAHAGRWVVNEKGAVTAAGRLPQAPGSFAARAHGLLAHLGDDPDRLDAAIVAAGVLLDEVRDVVGASAR